MSACLDFKRLERKLHNAFSSLLEIIQGRTRASVALRAHFEHLRSPLLEAYDRICVLLERCGGKQFSATEQPDLGSFLTQILDLCRSRSGFERASNMLKFLKAFFSDLVSRLESVITTDMQPVLRDQLRELEKLSDQLEHGSRASLASPAPVVITCLLFSDDEDPTETIPLPELTLPLLSAFLDSLLQSVQHYFYRNSFQRSSLPAFVMLPTELSASMFPPALTEKLQSFLEFQYEMLCDADFVFFSVDYDTSTIMMRVMEEEEPPATQPFIRLLVTY
eukprot:m.237394 g.237394  ORF g.237394 m.237394 type:complete len:278 (+) comp13130_c0_seq1:45-878(+)